MFMVFVRFQLFLFGAGLVFSPPAEASLWKACKDYLVRGASDWLPGFRRSPEAAVTADVAPEAAPDPFDLMVSAINDEIERQGADSSRHHLFRLRSFQKKVDPDLGTLGDLGSREAMAAAAMAYGRQMNAAREGANRTQSLIDRMGPEASTEFTWIEIKPRRPLKVSNSSFFMVGRSGDSFVLLARLHYRQSLALLGIDPVFVDPTQLTGVLNEIRKEESRLSIDHVFGASNQLVTGRFIEAVADFFLDVTVKSDQLGAAALSDLIRVYLQMIEGLRKSEDEILEEQRSYERIRRRPRSLIVNVPIKTPVCSS